MSNNTVTLDLIDDLAINIGSTYEIDIRLCNAPDLTSGYSGLCQIRQNLQSTTIVISPVITVVTKDIFKLKIEHSTYPTDLQAGNYIYDVLFSKTDHRFFPVGGKCQLKSTSTRIT